MKTKGGQNLPKFRGKTEADLTREKSHNQKLQVKVTSLHARKQIDEEITNIMKNSEAVQAEREKLIYSVERSSLDERRLEEMKGFICNNNPLEQFDKDLFRKLIRQAVVHSRNEIEFVFIMGFSRRVAVGKSKEKETPA